MNYGQKLREVNLVGEGYFKVTKMANRPFIVHTSKAHIKALGTEFNVKAYPEENMVETILVKGLVAIQKTGANGNPKDFTAQNSILLKPGQKSIIFRETKVSKNDTPVDEKTTGSSLKTDFKLVDKKVDLETLYIEVETSWKESRWIIQGSNLNELFVELGRRLNVSIRLTSEDLKKYQFSGIIQNETLEQVFDLMSLTFPISYHIEKGKVEISLNKQLDNKYKRPYIVSSF